MPTTTMMVSRALFRVSAETPSSLMPKMWTSPFSRSMFGRGDRASQICVAILMVS
jgi:hypothetical protein